MVPDHIGKQGWVGSSLYRPQVGFFQVFGFFLGVARKLMKVSEIAEMPWEIAREASGSPGKSREVLGSLGKGTEHF